MTMEIPLRDRQRRTSSRTATAQNRMTKILMTNAYNTLRAHHRDAGGVLEASRFGSSRSP
jgi:hypothetical protein